MLTLSLVAALVAGVAGAPPHAGSVRASTGALAPIPALEKVVVGLNAFAFQVDGTPDTGADPGLLNMAIFNLTSTAAGKSWNGVWSIPDALAFRPAPSCSYNTQVTTVTSSLGFLQTLHEWAITTTHFLFWSHTDDHEFHEVAQQTVSSQMILTKAKAMCTSYTTAVDYGALTPAAITNAFAADVAALPTSAPSDPSPLLEFISKWGTHYLDSATLGASASILTSFTQENYTKLESESTNMGVGATINFLAAFGDASLASDSNFYMYEAFTQAAASQVMVFAGPVPPVSADDVHINATAWAATVQLPDGNPTVIAYTAANLSSLISRADLFPAFNASTLAAKASVLQDFIDNGYCTPVNPVPCVAFQRNSAWDTSLSLPLPLRSSAVVSDGRFVYAVGGCVTNTVASAVSAGMLVWDTTGSQTWGMTSPFMQVRPPFYGANATDQDGLAFAAAAVNLTDLSVVVVGGIDATGAPQTGITRYDPNTGLWRVEGSISNARSAHCAALVGGTVIIIGGSDAGGNALNSVELFDAAQGSTSAGSPIPAALMRHACVVMNSSVWVFGGMTGASGSLSPVDSVYIYTPATDTWSSGPQAMPTARCDHAAAVVGDAVFIVGGLDATGAPDTSVPVFNTSGGAFGGWAYAPPLPQGRVGAAATVFYQPASDKNEMTQGPNNGGYIIAVVGGAAETGGQSSALTTVAQLKVFDTNGNYYYNPDAVMSTVQKLRARQASLGGSLPSQIARARAAALARPASSPVAPSVQRSMVSATGGASLPVWPFVDFLSHTYNPIVATPTAQLDVGWLANGAFQVACPTCFTKGKTFNGVYSVPDGVSVSTSAGAQCSYTANSLVIRTAAELQASLYLFAQLSEWSFNLNLLLATAFSAGATTSISGSASVSASEAIITSTATCTVFEMSLDTYDFAPAFWPGFVASVEALPTDLSDLTPWLEFVSRYGLAYPVSMVVGGTASEVNSMSQLNYSQSLSVDASIDVQASASFIFLFGASSNTGGAFAFSEWLSFSETVDSNYTQCAPSCPPVNEAIIANASGWYNAVQQAPVPITYKLLPLWDLIGNVSSARRHVHRRMSATGSLAARAARANDVAAAARYNAAAALLEQFAASGAYCSLTPGCQALTGGPYWNAPEAAPARMLPTPLTGAVSGLLPPAANGVPSLIILAGGVTAVGGAPTATTLLLDTNQPLFGWMAAAPMPAATAFASGAIVGSGLYVTGGINAAQAATNSTLVYTASVMGGSWAAVAPMPLALCNHASASVASCAGGSCVYVFGGCSDGPACAAPSAAVLIYSTSTGAWSTGSHTLPQGPSWGITVATSADGSVIYVAGGVTPTSTSGIAFMFVYTVATNTWDALSTTTAPAPFAFASSMLLPNQRILVTGGFVYDAVAGTAAASTSSWMYDPSRAAWTAWTAAPWPSSGASAVLLPAGCPGVSNTSTTCGLSCVNATLPVLWLVGGMNSTAASAPAINLVAQLRNLPLV